MAIALPHPPPPEWSTTSKPQTTTITDMLARGMTREEVARELVSMNTVSNIKDAQIMIAFALGETTGDLRNADERDPEYFIRRRRSRQAPLVRQKTVDAVQ